MFPIPIVTFKREKQAWLDSTNDLCRYQMMVQHNKRAKERAQNTPAPTEEQFLATKDQLLQKTAAHCEYLQSLM